MPCSALLRAGREPTCVSVSQAVFLSSFPAVYSELLKLFDVREVANLVQDTLGSLPPLLHVDDALQAVKLQCIGQTVESQLYTNPGGRFACVRAAPHVLRGCRAASQGAGRPPTSSSMAQGLRGRGVKAPCGCECLVCALWFVSG